MEQIFLENIKETFEIDSREINLNDEFRSYDEWDSLAYLSLIAMIDEEYDTQIEEAEFQKLITVGDIFTAVNK